MKFLLRPFVLQNEYGSLSKIFVLSYPNFCEAIVGTIFLTFVLLIVNSKFKKGLAVKEKYIPFISVFFSGIYVLLQEYKIHDLGGVNVYDPYDVAFSVLGLIIVLLILIYIEPKVAN